MVNSTFYNRVMFQAVSSGIGDFVVSAAVIGYSTPAQRGVANGTTVTYTAETVNKTQWETGTGIYNSGTVTISRAAIRESSNAGLIVNFATAPIVWFDYQAQDIERTYVLDWVNVKSFGAVGNGVTDDTVAIQAAIDYAYAQGINVTYIPAGSYKVSAPLYLDPPLNLRVNFANPTIFNFSMALVGDPTLPNHEGDGSILVFTVNNIIGVIVGPGQGMAVRDLNIIGPSGLNRIQQDSAGVALGLTGGNGGSTRAMIERVLAENFYTGFETSVNNFNALCDSNTFVKCFVNNGYIGFWFRQTQNFINTLIDCQPDATLGVYNPNGVDVKIVGGNYSTSGPVNTYAISAVSVLTATGSGNTYIYTFDATITTPDSSWTGGANGPRYNSFSFETVSFGVVTCTLVSYNSGTKVCSFKIYQMFGDFNFGAHDAQSSTDLQAELQACTSIFAAERATTFTGNNMSVDGIHVENPDTPTTFVNGAVSFGSNRPVVIRNSFFNYDPTGNLYAASGTPAIRGRYMCAAAHFPFMTTAASGNGVSDIRMEDCTIPATAPPLLDIIGASRITLSGISGINFNVRSFSSSTISAATNDVAYYEAGVFSDEGHFGAFSASDRFRQSGWGFAPFWGWRPAPYTTPAVKTGDIAILSGTLPAMVSPATCTYPLLWGGQMYRENSFSNIFGSAPPKQFWSEHSFYSYGQDINTTNCPGLSWSYKGQSFVVYCNDMNFIFPGLGVKLNDTSSDVLYMVTGVWQSLGYFTVVRNIPFIDLLSGTKTVTYTSNVIVQEPYVIRTLGSLTAPVTKTNDFTIATTENWLINNKPAATCTVTFPAAASYPGREITIVNYQTFTVVSASANITLQDGTGTGTAILPATAGKWATLVSNGTNWVIMQSG